MWLAKGKTLILPIYVCARVAAGLIRIWQVLVTDFHVRSECVHEIKMKFQNWALLTLDKSTRLARDCISKKIRYQIQTWL